MTLPFLDRAGHWFLRSGIQNHEGGVARYRRLDCGGNLAVSAEITGYAASALVYLYRLTGEHAYLERARQTAWYLAGIWDADLEAFPFEPDPAREQLSYFFDSGIIIRGMLAVWRETGQDELLDVALKCGLAMMRDFNAGREFHPVLALPAKDPVFRDERWSRNPGCYQLKAAMGWLELAEQMGDSRLREAYELVLTCSLQSEKDFLPGDADPHRVMDRLHAYCYFLEGALPVAGRAQPAAIVCAGIGRVAAHLREIAPSFVRSDVYAQLLRVRLLADLASVAPLDEAAAASEAESLERFQRSDGGFWFGSKSGSPLPFVNPVSTAFGLQALCLWHEHQEGLLKARTLDEHRRLLI